MISVLAFFFHLIKAAGWRWITLPDRPGFK